MGVVPAAARIPDHSHNQIGNSKRRIFYGPSINNFDLTLQKSDAVRLLTPSTILSSTGQQPLMDK
jgi:hypothetical protein